MENGLEPARVTLEDVLMFATGAAKIPPLGFGVEPTLVFLHDPIQQMRRVFPEANTCSLIFRLPLLAWYEVFSDKMISGIVQSPHFGTARLVVVRPVNSCWLILCFAIV